MPRSRRPSSLVLAPLLAAWVVCTHPCPAAPEPGEAAQQSLREGKRLLEMGMPALAVIQFREALDPAHTPKLGPDEARAARLLLASSQLHGRQPDEALATLKLILDLGSGTAAAGESLLKAQVLAALKDWEAALEVCRAIPHDAELDPKLAFAMHLTCGEIELGRGNFTEAEVALRDARALADREAIPGEGRARVRFLQALTHLRQGQPAECVRHLEGMVPRQSALLGKLVQTVTTPPAEDFELPAAAKEVVLLQAEANAAQGQYEVAARLCDLALRHPAGLTPETRLRTAARKAYYEEAAGYPDEAEDTLLLAVRENEEPDLLKDAFAHLLALYTRHGIGSKISLGPLMAASDPLREPYAEFLTAFLALRSGDHATARETLEAFLKEHPEHPLSWDARLLAKRLPPASEGAGTGTAASREAPTPPGEFAVLFDFETALVWLESGDFPKAMQGFERVAAATGEKSRLGISARYDQALAALGAQNPREFQLCLQALEKRPEAEGHVRALRLAEAAQQISRGKLKAARETLEFPAEVPADRNNRAIILLAELELAEGHAGNALQLVQNETPSEAAAPSAGAPPAELLSTPATTEEETAYIAFWALDAQAGTDRAELIAAARKYLERFPATALSPLIRFKLGELYFQQSAFGQAQLEFEQLADQTTDPVLKETAEFQTGRAAALSMSERGMERALEIYAELAKNDGKLKDEALLEMAVLLRDTGSYAKAATAFEELAKGRRPSDEMRLNALQGLAQCLFSEATGLATTTAPHPTGAAAGVAATPPPDAEARELNRAKLQRCLSVCEDILEGAENEPVWRHFALYLQGRCWQEMGDADQALDSYRKVITKTNAPGAGVEPEYLWLYRAGFGAVEILEERGQLTTALSVLGYLGAQGGPRAAEAAERMKMIRLKNFIWDDPALDPVSKPSGN